MEKMRYILVRTSAIISFILLSLILLVGDAQPLDAAPVNRIAPGLRQSILDQGHGEYLLYLKEQSDLSAAYDISNWDARGRFVYDTLRKTARTTQAGLLDILQQQQAAGNVQRFQSFFIANAILVNSNVVAFDLLSRRADVARVEIASTFYIAGMASPNTETVIEWNIQKVNAPQVWAEFGVLGQGIVVANIDTGVDYDHPALVNQYRGNLGGGVFNHDFNWYDPTKVCNIPYGVPCDNDNHGTHTMGVIVGNKTSDNRIGMAPAARWIAVKACDETTLCPAPILLQALEWILAPCPLSSEPGSSDCRSDLRPHVVANSWTSSAADSGLWLTAVQNLRAAGIFPAFSAGISGPEAGTISAPAGYAPSFAVGATNINDEIAPFSSRGPSPLTNEIKPDVVAPGVAVRSSINGGGYDYFSGSSVASAHVAGCYALLKSALSFLSLETAEDRLRNYAVDLGMSIPDYDYGYGRLDCYRSLVDGQPGFILNVLPAAAPVCISSITGGSGQIDTNMRDAAAPSGSAHFQIHVNPLNGYNAPVSLSITNVPGFVRFGSVNPVPVPGKSAVTLGGGDRPGVFRVNIVGTGPDADSNAASIELKVYDANPGNAALLSPAHGDLHVPLTPTFQWNATNPGDAYLLIVNNQTGDDLRYAITVKTRHMFSMPLAPSSIYYWSVQAYNPCGSGSFAPPSIFRTQDILPAGQTMR